MINFPEGFSQLNRDAFNDCESLKYVILPSSISSINISSFGLEHNLETIILKTIDKTYSIDMDGKYLTYNNENVLFLYDNYDDESSWEGLIAD